MFGWRTMNKGQRFTTIFVCGVMGALLMNYTFKMFGLQESMFWVVVFLVEARALLNNHLNDTISEIIWYLKKRTIVPLLFGIYAGYLVGIGYLDPKSLAIGILYGHFFFDRMEEK